MSSEGLKKWLGAFLPEDPIRKVANVTKRNRVSAVLADLQGIGCRIEKPTNGEGFGWRIIVDGSSDIVPDSGQTPGAGFVGVDRKFSIDNNDAPGTAAVKIANEDTNGLDTAELGRCLMGAWDRYTNPTTGARQVRFHIPVAPSGTPVYILGKTTGNELVWVSVTDTCDTGV